MSLCNVTATFTSDGKREHTSYRYSISSDMVDHVLRIDLKRMRELYGPQTKLVTFTTRRHR